MQCLTKAVYQIFHSFQFSDFDIYCRFNQERDEVLIPQWLFDDRKECLVRLSFATANEVIRHS